MRRRIMASAMLESGRGRTAPRKDEIARLELPNLAENSHRPIAQRDAMLALAFHAAGRDRPKRFLDIDLFPFRAKDFAGARGSEDGEFQRERAEARLFAKPFDEGRNRRVGERAVMIAPLGLGKPVLQIAFPLGGVVAASKLRGLGGVKDLLDAPAQPGGRLGFSLQIGRSTARPSSVVISET